MVGRERENEREGRRVVRVVEGERGKGGEGR